jgi:hypothetical protein
MPQAPTKKGRATTRARPPSRTRLEQLIEEAIADANDESEQRMAFLTLIADKLALPFETQILEMRVMVKQVKLGAADDVVAVCQHGKTRQAIPILDPPQPCPPPAGAEWIEAYRRWVRGR